ncbi:MAG: hypothetical protein BWK80_56710, partial [Desulfobacteraceae bacterium IS3]
VIVKTEDRFRSTPDDLNLIFVRSPGGEMVNLSNLVTASENVTAQSLNHFSKLRAVIITANIAPGYSQGEALAFLESAAKSILPEHAMVDYDGQSREYRESGSSLMTTFFLSRLLFI